MNILITGDLFSFALTFAKEFSKEKNKIILAGENANSLRGDNKNLIFHSINPADALFQDALASYNFDFVIYISVREEQLAADNKNIGQQLDGLRNTLDLCTKENVKRFFYVSSTEVYGNMLDSTENVEPQPSSLNGYTLLTGERYCMFYHYELGLKTTILRLTHVYGPDEHYGLLYRIVQECNNQSEVILPAKPDTLSSFLHVEDVVDFFKRAMDEEIGKDAQIVNLSCANPISFSTLAQSLNKHFPDVEFDFDSEKRIFTQPAPVDVAKRVFGWLDLHDLRSGLENYVELTVQRPAPQPSSLKMAFNKLSGYQETLKWVELIVGAGLVHYLSELTTILIQFKYVDFRLLFVVVMGSLYGIQFGLWASLLVSLSILYAWYQLGFDWALLVYNVGNWFPFALYFLAGLITGFNRDKTESALLQEQKQSNLIYGKYVFLYGVFDEIRKLKDEFREQLIGYRDSFGKIYSITRELDASQEQAVYFRALGIIEDLMQSYSIAIYSLDGAYARLEVNSYTLNDKISKSLKLSDFPELLHHIDRGIIFQNTALLPNYPAYVAPVLNNSYPFNVPVAIVVIWSVKFDQYSTYYLNLFKVICGLIQDALVRAAAFMDLNYEKMYVPATKILTPEAFMDILRIRADMKKNKVTDYQLLKIAGLNQSLPEIYSKISEGIRSVDIVGRLNDGACYILLTQADQTTAQYVIERFAMLGIQSDLVNGKEFLLDKEMYATVKEILSDYPA